MSKNNKDFFKEKNVWSEVKDELLGCYLKPYVYKILHTHKPSIFIDCFAGKGIFDDGKKGSPLIALDIINDCLENTKVSNAQIQSFFIELNYAYILKENIANYNNTRVIPGKYEDNILELLGDKIEYNVFLYIDPYGIKSLDCSLFDMFSDRGFNSIELLINMNSFGFIREACRVYGIEYNDVEPFDEITEYEPSIMDSTNQTIQDLNRIAGGDYWKEIIESYKSKLINGYEAEIRFANQYCTRLNQKYKYVLNMPIRLKMGQRPKYRLIHATNHEDGCVLMYDNICKRWEVLSAIQNNGQMNFFNETIENKTVDKHEIEIKLKSHLKKYIEDTKLNIVLAEFYTEFGVICNIDIIRDILSYFESNNCIIITRIPPLTKNGKPSKFLTQSNKQSISIRSKL